MKDFILPQHSRSYVGGGNISAILGISPFTTPLAAYHGIVNGDPEHDEDTLRFFKRRKALEPYAAAMLEERGFAVMRQNERYTHPDYPFLRAEVDAEVGCGDGVRNAEFKSVAPFASKVWGIDGSDDIPDYVMAQVQHGMSVTGRDKGAFALAVIGLDVSRVYPVQYDTDLAEMIHARAVRFWEDHVLKRVPPEPTTVGDILDFVAPDPTATRDARDLGIEQELLALRDARRSLKTAEGEVETLKTRIQIAMAEATVLMLDGRVAATWKASERNSLDTKALKAAHPEIAAEFNRTTPVRTFLIKE